MPILKKEKFETFATMIASGIKPDIAYCEANQKEMSKGSAQKGAQRWLDKLEIKTRIAEIKDGGGEDKPIEFKGKVLEQIQAQEILSRIAKNTKEKGMTRITACRVLGEWKGWKAAEEVNQTMRFMTDMPGPKPLPEEEK